MTRDILAGICLLLCAGLSVWKARDPVALARDPNAAWLVQSLGPTRAGNVLRNVALGGAAFLAIMGLVCLSQSPPAGRP